MPGGAQRPASGRLRGHCKRLDWRRAFTRPVRINEKISRNSVRLAAAGVGGGVRRADGPADRIRHVAGQLAAGRHRSERSAASAPEQCPRTLSVRQVLDREGRYGDALAQCSRPRRSTRKSALPTRAASRKLKRASAGMRNARATRQQHGPRRESVRTADSPAVQQQSAMMSQRNNGMVRGWVCGSVSLF